MLPSEPLVVTDTLWHSSISGSPQPRKRHILVVDDDAQVAEFLAEWLRDSGYNVAIALDGLSAVNQTREQRPDLVLMDIGLGSGPDGIGVARVIRESTNAPVIFLTAAADPQTIERAAGIKPSGYILKPFPADQAAASIRLALHQKAQPPGAQQNIRVHDLEIDFLNSRVLRGSETLRLTRKEFQILACLAEVPGRAFSPESILVQVWGHRYLSYSHTVRVHIGNLRRKLDNEPGRPPYIETVPGIGYRLREPSLTPSLPGVCSCSA